MKRMEVVEVKLVTPELATEWLKRNRNNRSISPQRVEHLAKEMLAGRWRLTNQGIAFSWEDELIDGQHRLMAIIQSGTTQRMLVLRGLEDATVVDVGRNRTISDMLRMYEKVPNGRRAAAIIQQLVALETGQPRRAFAYAEIAHAYRIWQRQISVVIEHGMRGERDGLIPAPVGAALALAYRDSPSVAESFAVSYLTGAELHEGDPELMLRTYMLKSGPARTTNDRLVLARKTLNAITARRDGRRLGVLKDRLDVTSDWLPIGLVEKPDEEEPLSRPRSAAD